jgi:predicted small lipoprotein YifL
MHMKKNMPKTVLKTAYFLGVCLLSAACGTKGPLYIPEQRYPDGVPKEAPKDVPKDVDKGVNNDATKKYAPEANSSAASSPAQ